MRRAVAAILCGCALAAVAGCGGSDESTEAATTAAPAPSPTVPGGDLAGRLPPQDAVAGLRAGPVRPLPTAQAFVDALYQIGDPARDAAQERLEEGGYAEGVLRDQAGEDPEGGVALVRSYVVRMRDDEAARQEVADAVAEVEGSTAAGAQDVEVAGVDDAQALRLEVSQGGIDGSVIFVTFADGPYVHGIQAVAGSGADLPEDEVIEAAQELDAQVS